MKKNRTLPNQDELHTCMSVLDQIGVNRTDVVEVMGSRRWSKTLAEVANKDGDKYFVLGVYNRCKFVSIRTKDDGNMESASPEHGLIVQKESDEGESGTNQFRVQDSLHTPSTLADDCSAGDMDSASPKHGVTVKKKSKGAQAVTSALEEAKQSIVGKRKTRRDTDEVTVTGDSGVKRKSIR